VIKEALAAKAKASRRDNLSSVPTVAAWAGMIAFFAFGIVFWATRSHPVTYWMLGSLILWVTAGIMVIRIRQFHRTTIP
jgi:hypothetical protein